MLDIEMIHTAPFALVRASGTLGSIDEVEMFLSALAFVPDDDDLVIDLTRVHSLTTDCASAIGDCLVQRVVWSEAVVVSNTALRAQLVLAQVDRVVSIVQEPAHARKLIEARRRTVLAEPRL